MTIEDQIAEGDMVVTRWTARGTHTPASSKAFRRPAEGSGGGNRHRPHR